MLKFQVWLLKFITQDLMDEVRNSRNNVQGRHEYETPRPHPHQPPASGFSGDTITLDNFSIKL